MAIAEQAEPRLWTHAAYNALPDAAERYEITKGELFLPPAPNVAHQTAVIELSAMLVTYVREHELGLALNAPIDVVLDEENVVQPDVVFVSRERREIVKSARIEGSPDLVVEILSPFSITRDRVRKMRLYARFEVPNYWIFDPENHIAELYRLKERQYALEAAGEEEDVLFPSLFPGLAIPLKKLWGG
ncbi:MAG: Uma2 family endonuclease [Armatimonadetes bacterium]|nr:Uma2 family endonuclease [Armatimonadota bacterium]